MFGEVFEAHNRNKIIGKFNSGGRWVLLEYITDEIVMSLQLSYILKLSIIK